MLLAETRQMPTHEQVLILCRNLGLTPYQTDTIANNRAKYHTEKMVKRNGIVMIPYRADARDWREFCARVLFGPRADLLGADRPLAIDRRGIRSHHDGFAVPHLGGVNQFKNPFGYSH